MNKRMIYRKPKSSPESKKIEKQVVEFPKTLNTYIGQKGYTIPKSELSADMQLVLKEKLMAKPLVMGVAFGQAADTAFPIYRESDNKFYVPRYFGEKEFGAPKSSKLDEGEDIDISFKGSLRDIQIPVVVKYLDCVTRDDYGGGGLLELPCAFGKCLAKDTPVIMFDGTIRKVQDIRVDEYIMGDDSTRRRVFSLARGRERMYKIKGCGEDPCDNYVVNESHILSLKRVISFTKVETVDISVREFLNLSFEEKQKYWGYRVPLDFSTKGWEVDPYVIGVCIGDFENETAILNKCIEDPKVHSYVIRNGLLANKLIPPLYKYNNRTVRLCLMAGILDGNNSMSVFRLLFPLTKKDLINDIIFLARSLGIYIQKQNIIYKNQSCVYLHFYGNVLNEISSYGQYHRRLSRKLPCSSLEIEELMYSFKIEPMGEDDYYGFEISGNRRFVLGDLTVTHNTVLSLNIIAQLKKKTLVIVNKEFLMNQWIERIGEFLPTARVGKIQGQIIDIEGKDIVLGMLQSLSQKDYPAATFSSFGLTIIDEVHHISSEVFSRALFKIVSKYMLGLSATMERKDGTTDVFKQFLGDVAFKGTRDEEHPVCVRAIEYCTTDADFNEVEYDFRGNPKYSTMIVKLCDYNRRSDFIVRIVEDLFAEQPKGQIMILAHNRSLLTYLHDAIEHRGFATVGYYVGGMKEAHLKETEGKQVVIATYAMAAEALDIKTLTTLVMATPKTDIVQSVGRILRSKHSNPIVVDIVDKHELFQKQWVQRRRFYKKCNYRIRMITSNKYAGMKLSWDTDRTWQWVFEPKKTGAWNKQANDVGEDAAEEDEDSDAENIPALTKDIPARKCLVAFDPSMLESEGI